VKREGGTDGGGNGGGIGFDQPPGLHPPHSWGYSRRATFRQASPSVMLRFSTSHAMREPQRNWGCLPHSVSENTAGREGVEDGLGARADAACGRGVRGHRRRRCRAGREVELTPFGGLGRAASRRGVQALPRHRAEATETRLHNRRAGASLRRRGQWLGARDCGCYRGGRHPALRTWQRLSSEGQHSPSLSSTPEGGSRSHLNSLDETS